MKTKVIVAQILVGLMVTGNAYAAQQGGGGRPVDPTIRNKQQEDALKKGETRHGVVGGQSEAASQKVENAKLAKAVASKCRTLSEVDVQNALNEGKIVVQDTYTTKEKEKIQQKLPIVDVVSKINQVQTSNTSKEHVLLAEHVLEFALMVHTSREPLAHKLIGESLALAMNKDAKPEEIAGYIRKFEVMKEGLKNGIYKNFDDAFKSVFNDKEKKELEICVRG